MSFLDDVKRLRCEVPGLGLVGAKRMMEKYGTYDAAIAACGENAVQRDPEAELRDEVVELRRKVKELQSARDAAPVTDNAHPAGDATTGAEPDENTKLIIQSLASLAYSHPQFGVLAGNAIQELERLSAFMRATPATGTSPRACWSCEKPYSAFPLDVNVPRSQWLLINQNDDGGLLCAACIVDRGAHLIPGVTCAHLVFEVTPRDVPAQNHQTTKENEK